VRRSKENKTAHMDLLDAMMEGGEPDIHVLFRLCSAWRKVMGKEAIITSQLLVKALAQDPPLHEIIRFLPESYDWQLALRQTVSKGGPLVAKQIPLDLACKKGLADVLEFFLLKGGSEISDMCISSLLEIACTKGDVAVAHILLSRGVDVNARNENDMTVLQEVCSNPVNHKAIVELLISSGAGVNVVSACGLSPLHALCKAGDATLVELLVSKGADINRRTAFGLSPLYVACGYGHGAVVELLLAAGADISSVDENGVTPLSAARRAGHDAVVQLMLAKGDDLHGVGNGGVTPMVAALRSGHAKGSGVVISTAAHAHTADVGGVAGGGGQQMVDRTDNSDVEEEDPGMSRSVCCSNTYVSATGPSAGLPIPQTGRQGHVGKVSPVLLMEVLMLHGARNRVSPLSTACSKGDICIYML
jgi:ankyrin repeat protein